tara:strand:- start:337 stop:489 length:153 start_codon:yes stop_codon:yes gene_type:complete
MNELDGPDIMKTGQITKAPAEDKILMQALKLKEKGSKSIVSNFMDQHKKK